MPCQVPGPGHSHEWPATGILTIQACEIICGYCRSSSGKLLGYTWTDWFLLWEHVLSVHRLGANASHPNITLAGVDQLPAGLLRFRDAEYESIRQRLREACTTLSNSNPDVGRIVQVYGRPYSAMLDVERTENAKNPRMPFALLQTQAADGGELGEDDGGEESDEG